MQATLVTQICPSCDGAGFDFYHHEQKSCGYCGGKGIVNVESVDDDPEGDE